MSKKNAIANEVSNVETVAQEVVNVNAVNAEVENKFQDVTLEELEAAIKAKKAAKIAAEKFAKEEAAKALRLAEEKRIAQENKIAAENAVADLIAKITKEGANFTDTNAIRGWLGTYMKSMPKPASAAPVKVTKENGGATTSSVYRTPAKEKREFLLPLIQGAEYTKTELLEKLCEAFPLDSRNENRILLTDSQNPRFCRFEYLCGITEDGKYGFTDVKMK